MKSDGKVSKTKQEIEQKLFYLSQFQRGKFEKELNNKVLLLVEKQEPSPVFITYFQEMFCIASHSKQTEVIKLSGRSKNCPFNAIISQRNDLAPKYSNHTLIYVKDELHSYYDLKGNAFYSL